MIYIVTFEIHRDCQIRNYVYYCTAKNAKEACQTARWDWIDSDRLGHQFALHATRSRIQDEKLLNAGNWKGTDALNKFVKIDSRTWRVNGRNLYGV